MKCATAPNGWVKLFVFNNLTFVYHSLQHGQSIMNVTLITV
jgi:hypothetical protein